MPNCEQLIIDIQETIRENGRQEVTGPVLQQVLLNMVYVFRDSMPLTMWQLLGAATEEQINVTHLSATDVAGMLTRAGYKLTDKFDTYFGVDDDGNIYVKDNRGFYGNSFISARGSDPEAGSGGGGSGGGGSGVDMESVWYALGQPTNEKINVSHLSANNVAQLLTAAGYKLTDTTYGLATDTVSGLIKTGYTENGKNYAVKLDAAGAAYVTVNWQDTTYGLATDTVSGLIKTGYTENGKNYAVKLDDTGAAYVTVNWQDKFDTYFGVDGDGNVYVKNNKGFWSNSFISARGSDPEAGSGSGGGLDVQAMWYALAQPTNEKINASHIPSLAISKITGLQDALDSKLEGITKAMVEAVLTGTVMSHNHDGRYAPLSGGLIPSRYLPSYVDDVVEYASLTAFPATGEAGKIYVALDTNLTYRWGGSSYVEISPSLALGHTAGTAYPGDEGAALAEQVKAMKTITDLFGVDGDGNVYVKDNRGFYGNSFVSARGGDPAAGSGGGSGVDMESVWYSLAQPTTEKINVSHIPALQQLSGQITNAQLANSAITVAGVSVPLGGAVTTAQIASALTGSGYKLTDTTYTLTKSGSTITLTGSNGSKTSVTDSNTTYTLGSFGITATAAEINRLDGITASTAELNFVDGVTSNIQTQLNSKANASALRAYALKDGSNASGMWPISISGIANRAAYLTSTYTGSGGLQPPSYFRGMGLKVNMMNKPVSYCDVIFVNGYGGNGADVPYVNALAFQKTANAHGEVYHARGDYGGSSWGTWYKFLDEYNYAGILDSRYLLKSAYTAADILAKLKTVDGSDSGLDADLLDGYSIASVRLGVSDFGAQIAAAGWYRVYTSATSNAQQHSSIILHIERNYVDPQNEHYTFSISVGFNGDINITQLSGVIGGHLITKIRVVWANSRSYFIDIYTDYRIYANWYSVYGQGYGTFSAFTAGATIPSGYSSYEFTTVEGCKSDRGFIGSLSGNASSATKLATARSIWGRSFDGSGDIRGNIIVGDAIIHGSVTSNNTRFISSDNASNIYFSVGGLVDLVAEPSCLRRGASNTSETLGTSTYRWANVYAVNGDYSGDLTVSGWINNALMLSQKGVSADGSDTTTFRINGHNLEFGGRGYAHQSYYFRPQYSASGATYADMFIQNASAADSPVFSTTHAFYRNGNAYHYGNLGLGTAAPQAKLDVIGTIRATTGIWSNGYVSAKGQDTTSDARYKRDVAALPAQAALAVLMRLRPSTWAWKDDGRRGAGFVAQEVMGVLPEAVREVGNGEDRHLALNYQMLHAYEVSALQTHETELERLRGRVNQLENEIKRIQHGS